MFYGGAVKHFIRSKILQYAFTNNKFEYDYPHSAACFKHVSFKLIVKLYHVKLIANC